MISCSAKKNPSEEVADASTQRELEINEKLKKPEEICFEDVRAYVFSDSCVECHNSERRGGGVDLSSFDAVYTHSNHLVDSMEPDDSPLYQTLMAESGPRRMPPVPHDPLTENQKMLVYQWIKHGAKESRGDDADVTQTLGFKLKPYFDNPASIDYAAVRKYVFEPGACLKCHSENSLEASERALMFGADMTSYQTLNFLNGIVPGQLSDGLKRNAEGEWQTHQGSTIYESVAINQSMPPAEDGYSPLSALRIKLLRLWILNCAPETVSEGDVLESPGHLDKVRECL